MADNTIATLINGVQTDRNTIRTKLIELGLATSTDQLHALAEAIEGIYNRGAVSATVQEGATYTIPAGYHNGSGTVSGVGGGGNYTLQSKIVTPTKSQQSVTADSGYYGLSDVTVKPIPETYHDVSTVNTAEGDVLTGKIFVTSDGVVHTGTMTDNGAVDVTLTGALVTYTIPKGYHNGSGKVKLVVETKSVTPTKSAQKITPSSGKVLTEVTVEAIPDEYITTTDANAVAADILDDKTAYVDGVKVVGSMPSNGDVSKTINGLSATSVTIPAGHTTGGTVSLTDDIANALAAI